MRTFIVLLLVNLFSYVNAQPNKAVPNYLKVDMTEKNIKRNMSRSDHVVILQIDTTKSFQQMEGFGAFNNLETWKNETDFNKYKFLVNDLGLTIMRFELPPSFQPKKDGILDLHGEVFGGPDLQNNFRNVRDLYKLGVKKFIATIWSPPAWMKTPNKKDSIPNNKNGGSLRPDMYGLFANYCAAYCKAFYENTGVELYAIGLQNEPEFEEPYNSCIYTPEEMREALRCVGRKFKKDSIRTKIYLPEALPAQQHLQDYFKAINSDSETTEYATVFAIHNYDSDGMNVGGAGAREWEGYAKLAAEVLPAKQLWMTETSGHPNNWNGAMLLAANMYNAIKYGNLTAWLWWSIADTKSSEVYGLIIDGKPTGRYFASKQFYHFVRPGAIRIETTTDDPDILALSFKSSGNYKYVTILINKSKIKVLMKLPSMPGKRELYLSTNTAQCALQKNIGIHETISLPAQSILTILWK